MSLQGNATLHLYPHFEPLRQIEGKCSSEKVKMERAACYEIVLVGLKVFWKYQKPFDEMVYKSKSL